MSLGEKKIENFKKNMLLSLVGPERLLLATKANLIKNKEFKKKFEIKLYYQGTKKNY